MSLDAPVIPRTPIRRGALSLVIVALLGLVLGACSAGSTAASSSTASGPTSSGSGVTVALTAAQTSAVADGADPADTDAAGVEWLCRPGLAPDPCTSSLTATVAPRSGPTHVERATDATHADIDCFYVYPTVSAQSGAGTLPNRLPSGEKIQRPPVAAE